MTTICTLQSVLPCKTKKSLLKTTVFHAFPIFSRAGSERNQGRPTRRIQWDSSGARRRGPTPTLCSDSCDDNVKKSNKCRPFLLQRRGIRECYVFFMSATDGGQQTVTHVGRIQPDRNKV